MKFITLLLLSLLILDGCAKKKLSRYRGVQGADSSAHTNGPLVDALEGDIESGNIPSDPGLNLVWKRYRSVEDGLARGLELPKEAVCIELGQHSCIDKVHLTSLGGNEPYVLAQWERAQSPTALTPVAVDRLIMSACNNRLQKDKEAGGAAVVFKHFPLADGAPLPNAAQTKAQTSELYQRFLARDPDAAELDLTVSFIAKMKGAEEAALSLCFAIGASIENNFL